MPKREALKNKDLEKNCTTKMFGYVQRMFGIDTIFLITAKKRATFQGTPLSRFWFL